MVLNFLSHFLTFLHHLDIILCQNYICLTFKPNVMMSALIERAQMSCCMTKPTQWPVCPAKTQISLGILPVWSESSLRALWVAKDQRFLHVDSEDWSDLADADLGTGHFVGFVMLRVKYQFLGCRSRKDTIKHYYKALEIYKKLFCHSR